MFLTCLVALSWNFDIPRGSIQSLKKRKGKTQKKEEERETYFDSIEKGSERVKERGGKKGLGGGAGKRVRKEKSRRKVKERDRQTVAEQKKEKTDRAVVFYFFLMGDGYLSLHKQ